MKYRFNILVALTLVISMLLTAASDLINLNTAVANEDSQDAKQKIYLPVVGKEELVQFPSQPGPGGLRAFPGAAGFGTDTPGGRGGKVIYVTNLNDSGSGSLRAAMEASGPRMVLFSVSGTISLKSDIIVKNPFMTVAGQTAPGEGIQIRDAQIKITTHDIVIRYLKVRSGDAASASNPDDRDGITSNEESNAYNIVIDHSTLIWGSDVGGATFLKGAHDSTISYSIVGEGLYVSRHKEGTAALGGHSMAMNITELDASTYPTRITIHHNLITTSDNRNPRIIGGENIDFVNNVVYNWRSSPSQGNPRSLNLVNNLYIAGPMTTDNKAKVCWLPKAEAGGSLRTKTVYESGNAADGFNTIRGGSSNIYVGSPFKPFSMEGFVESPHDAYNRIVQDAGANRQVAGSDGAFVIRRDSVDTRLISNLENRRGEFVNGVSFDGAAGFRAISWPNLAGGSPAVDNDGDGMPDDWERQYFGNTNRGSANDSSSDYDKDGYTDLEEYLNYTNPTQ